MPEDPNEHVAMMFHGLVSDLQRNDVARFEEDQKRDREARAALRHQQPSQGMSAGELLKSYDGNPDDDRKKIEDDLLRIETESKAAAAQKDKRNDPLPKGHFPPPPTSG